MKQNLKICVFCVPLLHGPSFVVDAIRSFLRKADAGVGDSIQFDDFLSIMEVMVEETWDPSGIIAYVYVL